MSSASTASVYDPVAEAFDRAPAGEPFPPDVLVEIQRAEAEIQAGLGVRHEDVPAWLEERARLRRAG
jgi:hypothetical protein